MIIYIGRTEAKAVKEALLNNNTKDAKTRERQLRVLSRIQKCEEKQKSN